MTSRLSDHRSKSFTSKTSHKHTARHKKTNTNSHNHRKAALPKSHSMKSPTKPKPKPKLKPSKSDLSEIDQERKVSTFSSDSERMRNLSSSDGMLVVRKRSVWARLNDPVTADDNDDDDDGDGDPRARAGPVVSVGETAKKRKHGIVPFIPSFRTDIMSVFRNSNTRRKNKDIPPQQQQQEQQSPPKHCLLRKAVRRSDIERVRKLLSTNKDIDVNASNARGITALHEAAIDGNCAMLKLLVEFGGDINMNDNEGYNALDYAVCGGDFECASFLLNSGANETRVRNGLIGFAN